MTPSEPLTKHSSSWLAISLAGSGAFVFIQILRWPLVSLLTVFVEPLLEIAVFLCFTVVGICCLVYAIRNRRSASRKVWLPVAICLSAAIIVVAVPFSELYLKFDFYIYQDRRTAVAEKLLQNPSLVTNVPGSRGAFVTLDPADSYLSRDDGEVLIDRRDGNTFVLFFTFRGILGRFSGFVYSPTDEPPGKDEFDGDGLEIKRLAPHWFWYAS